MWFLLTLRYTNLLMFIAYLQGLLKRFSCFFSLKLHFSITFHYRRKYSSYSKQWGVTSLLQRQKFHQVCKIFFSLSIQKNKIVSVPFIKVLARHAVMCFYGTCLFMLMNCSQIMLLWCKMFYWVSYRYFQGWFWFCFLFTQTMYVNSIATKLSFLKM